LKESLPSVASRDGIDGCIMPLANFQNNHGKDEAFRVLSLNGYATTHSGLWIVIPFKCILLALSIFIFVGPAEGRIRFRRTPRSGASSQSLRRKLHINSLITEPGTFEVEWGNAFSTSGDYSMPTSLKLTPATGSGFWARTELSAGFDTLVRVTDQGNRSTRFSDRLAVAATTVVYGGEKLNIALAPVASFFLRDEQGARLGGTLIARYDSGLHSAGFSAAWTGATSSSASNPAGTLDVGAGYGRQLAGSGRLARLTPHGNIVYERSSGALRAISFFEGLEYQYTERLAFDVSAQQSNLAGGQPDYQIVLGITWNLGSPRRWWLRH
jgi:hypothetical protein